MLGESKEGWVLLPALRRRLITGGVVTGAAGTVVCLALGAAGPGAPFLLAAVAGMATSALLLATAPLPAPPSAEVCAHASAGATDPGYSRWRWTLTLEAAAGPPEVLHGESECLDQPCASSESVLRGILAELATQGHPAVCQEFTAHRIE
ncbi:hypothetical protein [Streptomyces koyangensis]|uniref:hypothetical protein n=1 Tax=Streptomyces koyangensis TaxID=188770 RepID=UPI003BF4DA40